MTFSSATNFRLLLRDMFIEYKYHVTNGRMHESESWFVIVFQQCWKI